MRWYNAFMRWYNASMRWYNAFMRWYNAFMRGNDTPQYFKYKFSILHLKAPMNCTFAP